MQLSKEGVMDYVCICASCWKPNCSLLALGRLVLSMTQTGCWDAHHGMVWWPTIPYHTIPWWEAQPGNEAFGKVAGGTKAFQGFNKRFATCQPLLFSFAISADSVRSAHPAEDQANSVTADIRHNDC